MDWKVRQVRLEDAEAVVGILNPIIEAGLYTAFDTPFSTQEEREYIRTFPERGIFLVAEDTGDRRLVGFQSAEPFASYTHAFDHVCTVGTYVAMSHWRRGVASRLFEGTFEAAKSKGYEKIYTFIRADNQAGLATYRKHGFYVVGTAKKHAKINGRFIDEIIVEKLL